MRQICTFRSKRSGRSSLSAASKAQSASTDGSSGGGCWQGPFLRRKSPRSLWPQKYLQIFCLVLYGYIEPLCKMWPFLRFVSGGPGIWRIQASVGFGPWHLCSNRCENLSKISERCCTVSGWEFKSVFFFESNNLSLILNPLSLARNVSVWSAYQSTIYKIDQKLMKYDEVGAWSSAMYLELEHFSGFLGSKRFFLYALRMSRQNTLYPRRFIPPEISFSRGGQVVSQRLHLWCPSSQLTPLISLNSVVGCPRSFDAVQWL